MVLQTLVQYNLPLYCKWNWSIDSSAQALGGGIALLVYQMM